MKGINPSNCNCPKLNAKDTKIALNVLNNMQNVEGSPVVKKGKY
ncbi:MAG: hypothetical protein ACYCXQ_10215 [Candidatus Humimicrobiaceae bacterium]